MYLLVLMNSDQRYVVPAGNRFVENMARYSVVTKLPYHGKGGNATARPITPSRRVLAADPDNADARRLLEKEGVPVPAPVQ